VLTAVLDSVEAVVILKKSRLAATVEAKTWQERVCKGLGDMMGQCVHSCLEALFQGSKEPGGLGRQVRSREYVSCWI
jgi:hypothetical protein